MNMEVHNIHSWEGPDAVSTMTIGKILQQLKDDKSNIMVRTIERTHEDREFISEYKGVVGEYMLDEHDIIDSKDHSVICRRYEIRLYSPDGEYVFFSDDIRTNWQYLRYDESEKLDKLVLDYRTYDGKRLWSFIIERIGNGSQEKT